MKRHFKSMNIDVKNGVMKDEVRRKYTGRHMPEFFKSNFEMSVWRHGEKHVVARAPGWSMKNLIEDYELKNVPEDLQKLSFYEMIDNQYS